LLLDRAHFLAAFRNRIRVRLNSTVLFIGVIPAMCAVRSVRPEVSKGHSHGAVAVHASIPQHERLWGFVKFAA